MIKHSAKLFVKPEEDFSLINTFNGNIPYMICKLIQAELDSGEKEIEVLSYKENSKFVVDIPLANPDNDSVKEALKIEKMCDNVSVQFEEGKVKLVIDRVEK
jgi:hypothetical protein